MSIKTFTFLLILAFAWTSCKNDAATSGTTQSEPTTTEVAPATDPNALMGADANMAIQPATPAAAATQTAGTAGMKNPAHGEPGHVCGVPVGQILDGKTPSAPTTVVPTTAAPKPSAAPATGNATVAPGMNPPHGQPGHRCDISVGEPLNSKPKQ